MRLVRWVVLLLAACSGQGATEDVQDAGVVAANDGGRSGLDVVVTYNSASVTVSLATPVPVDLGGTPYVPLTEVLRLAVPQHAAAELAVGFLASDGFDPASRATCAALLPIRDAALTLGYVDPVTRNLKWDDSLQYPGCMNVHDVAQIRVVDHP